MGRAASWQSPPSEAEDARRGTAGEDHDAPAVAEEEGPAFLRLLRLYVLEAEQQRVISHEEKELEEREWVEGHLRVIRASLVALELCLEIIEIEAEALREDTRGGGDTHGGGHLPSS